MQRFLPLVFMGSIALNAMFFWSSLSSPVRLRALHPLLSPRVFAENPNDIIINFTDLRASLRSIAIKQNNMNLGVYFEYLPSGVSIGMNEKRNFITASLIKVPFIMGISKLIEAGQIKSDQVLTLKGEDLDPSFGSVWKRGEGATMTVDEAMSLTLTESDNTAALALNHLASVDPIRKVFDALDIPVDWSVNEPVVSAENYSSVFRCLYLSCYLAPVGSEHVLTLLTHTIFYDGIPAGVPKGIRVAHKIGVYDSPNSDKRVRLDCGIVYVPKRPYILCILGETDKAEVDNVVHVTQEISSTVYSYVSGVNQ